MRTALTVTPPSALRETVAGATGGGAGAAARGLDRTAGALAAGALTLCWASSGALHNTHSAAVRLAARVRLIIRRPGYYTGRAT